MNKALSYTKQIAALYGYEKALYFLAYTYFHRMPFVRWFEYLDTQLPAGTSETTRVRLAMRPAYRYIRPWMTLGLKTRIISYYYEAIQKRFSPAGLQSFLNPQGNWIAELTGKSDRKYAVLMLTETTKEGAIKLRFTDMESGIVLAMITGITGVDDKGHPVFWIGSVQGAHPPAGKDEIAFATKDLNNLRPKQAVFYAACALAEWFGIDAMMGPSRDGQIAMKVFYRKHKVFNDYNSFWEEFTEVKENGDYRVSLPLPRRQAEEVPSKRRKEWLLRYERIDAMSAGVKAALDTFCR